MISLAGAFPLSVLVLSGCQGNLLDAQFNGGSAFTLTGAADPGLSPASAELVGAILWVAAVDGEVSSWWTEVTAETRLLSYTIAVPPPPSPPSAAGAIPPEGWTGLIETDILFGIPALVDERDLTDAPLSADSALRWLIDPLEAPFPSAAYSVTRDHIVVVLHTENAVSRLGEGVAWDASPCVFDDVASGLTLYHRDGPHCGGWRPLGRPGEGTEFQGVTMFLP